MDQLHKKPKGFLSPFKNEDGSFKKWAPALLIIASIFFVRDIAGLSSHYLGNVENSEYRKEIDVLMLEIKDLGNNLLDENALFNDLSLPEYDYKFPGTRLMHEMISELHTLQQKAENEILAIEERSLDEINLAELNKIEVVEEMRTYYQKEEKILMNEYKLETVAYEEFKENITRERQQNPDDKFVKGLYGAFAEQVPDGIAMSEKMVVDMTTLYDKVDAYFEFMLINQGKYEFTGDGEIFLEPSVEAKYDQAIAEMEEAGEQFEKSTTEYMNIFSGKMEKFEELMNDQ